MAEFTRERYACKECPAFYKCDRENIGATAGGWEEKTIDGRKVICCRPAPARGKGVPMKRYAFYCLATKRGKLIAHVHDYIGKVPLWCPRLEGSK